MKVDIPDRPPEAAEFPWSRWALPGRCSAFCTFAFFWSFPVPLYMTGTYYSALRLASTIAIIPLLTGSGNSFQASTTAAKSLGSRLCVMLLLCSTRIPSMSGTLRL